MAAHAYFLVGEIEEGIQDASAFVEGELKMSTVANPDVITIRHGLLSVDDARRLRSIAELAPIVGDKKVMIISASRLFHEAQNALLKLFEEPPAGTILILVIPSEGLLLPTLRSRLLPLPHDGSKERISNEAANFLAAEKIERQKILAKIVDRTKSDNDEEKQAARLAAIHLVEDLLRNVHTRWLTEKNKTTQKELQLFLNDLNRFLPILHERSAPLKLIFEHILLTLPSLA
ncbi:hypothetical protein H0X32_01265 [Patescibacteria group bacterium]|nr:hypothetical protein [Patescibacteria group bacterium]